MFELLLPNFYFIVKILFNLVLFYLFSSFSKIEAPTVLARSFFSWSKNWFTCFSRSHSSVCLLLSYFLLLFKNQLNFVFNEFTKKTFIGLKLNSAFLVRIFQFNSFFSQIWDFFYMLIFRFSNCTRICHLIFFYFSAD